MIVIKQTHSIRSLFPAIYLYLPTFKIRMSLIIEIFVDRSFILFTKKNGKVLFTVWNDYWYVSALKIHIWELDI